MRTREESAKVTIRRGRASDFSVLLPMYGKFLDRMFALERSLGTRQPTFDLAQYVRGKLDGRLGQVVLVAEYDGHPVGVTDGRIVTWHPQPRPARGFRARARNAVRRLVGQARPRSNEYAAERTVLYWGALWIAPEMRGKGVARALLEELIVTLRAPHVAYVQADVLANNTEWLSSVEHMGFRRVSVTLHRDLGAGVPWQG